MKKTLKNVFYWCSLVCPIFDLLKAGLVGATKGLNEGIENFDRKLEQKLQEQIQKEFARQRQQLYEDSFTDEEKK